MLDLDRMKIEDVADALKLHYMDREVDQLAELLVPIAEESKSKDQEISDLNDQLDEKDDKITDLKDALKSLAEDVKAKVAEAILGL